MKLPKKLIEPFDIAFTKNDVRWPGKRNEKVVVNIQ
jgi:hypothetical protein